MHGICFARWLAVCLLLATVAVSARGQNGSDDQSDFAGTHSGSRIAPPFSSERIWRDPTRPRPVPRPPGTVGLSQIARAAGIIFSGTITSIARMVVTSNEGPRVVAVTFRVESGIRGASAGRDLTIFEWIGLWTGGQRYQVGDRVLLFLYPPSKLGLTSCVGGTMGRFLIDRLGPHRLCLCVCPRIRENSFQVSPGWPFLLVMALSDTSSDVRNSSAPEAR